MYFSQRFGVTQTAADDWFDTILDADTKLFVDPFLIFQDSEERWSTAHDRLIEHFNICFHLIAEGRSNPDSVPYKKALALLHFPEPREFCLGYTEQGTQGAGGGAGYAHLIASAMEDAIARGLQDLRHFEELGVLNEGIGPDRISDLTCNVLRHEFIEYTKDVASAYNLQTQSFKMGGASFDHRRIAWRSEDVELPLNPFNNKAVLLVPKRFLRELPVLNADDWWENYEAEQLRNDLNYEVLGNVKKKDIVAMARRNPESVRAWANAKEGTPASPYDLEKDPNGVWLWQKVSQEFVRNNPARISPSNNNEEFVAFIAFLCERFKNFVEHQGGWRLLWNDGNEEEKPEEAAQLLFMGIARSYCEANNIVVDREVNLGRGPVDFKFSNGYSSRALLEVKKLHNGRFLNGLSEQLPSYLRSDTCNLGWYVVLRYRDTGVSKERAKEISQIVREIERDRGFQIAVVDVDVRPKISASKL